MEIEEVAKETSRQAMMAGCSAAASMTMLQ